MTNPTRAEIQAQIETVVSKAFAAGRACAVFEANPCPITREYSIEAAVELDRYQCGLGKAIEGLITRGEQADAADTPIGYVNVFYDGGIGSVHGSAEEAATVAEILGGVKETAVPLYRHPAPPQGTAVAPKGVVEELRSLVYDVIDAARRCNSDPKPSKEYHAAWDAITAALSRITELPEPSEWARGTVVITKAFWPEPWTDEQCRDLAAALLESEARDE